MYRSITRWLLIAATAAVATTPAPIHGQVALNGSFEEVNPGARALPLGWIRSGAPNSASLSVTLDSTITHSGLRSLRVARATPGNAAPLIGFRFQLPRSTRSGWRLGVWTRTDSLVNGAAELAVYVRTPGQMRVQETLPRPGVSGTTPWTRHVADVGFDSTATEVLLAIRVTGAGTVWFDDVELMTNPAGPSQDFDTVIAREFLDAAAPFVQWAARTAAPLSLEGPPQTRTSLQPLTKALAGATVIGLGEGTHGTHEFGVVRTRLIQNLADMGLTDILFEASLPDALAVDEYVQGGSGNPESLLHAMGFWIHEHEAVVELVTWLRAWNQNPGHRRKIHFRGIDNPFPAGALECVRRYGAAAGVAVSLPDSASAPFLYARDRPALLRQYAQADTAAVGQATTSLAVVVATLSARNALPEERGGVSLPVARRCAEVAAQAHARYARRGGNLAARDSIMAVNALWWLAQSGPGAKGVVWAHNYHVAADTMATTGAFLRRALGERYAAVALLFDRGEVLTRPWPEARTDPFRERQEPPAIISVAAAQGPLIEHVLRATGKGSLTLGLRRDAMPAAVVRFLGTPVWSRDFGEWFGPTDTGLYQYTFGRAFDALVFVESASASRLTPAARARR